VAQAQWDRISIDFTNGSPWRCHHNSNNDLSGLVDDVVYLTGGPSYTLFCSQTFGAPQAFYNLANDETFFIGEGAVFDGYGDAISLLKRRTDGWFDTNPAPNPNGTEVLRWPSVNPATDCPPQANPCNWTWHGGLGAGAGLAATPAATSGGYRYFAAVVVGFFNQAQVGAPFDVVGNDLSEAFDPVRKADCAYSRGNPNPPNPAQAWISWAVSSDLLSWHFVNRAGNGLTDDPKESLYLIARGDRQHSFFGLATCVPQPAHGHAADGGWGTRFKHVRMFFNRYDGYFYLQVGWKSSATLKQGSTWWRMRFNPGDSFGLGPIDRLTNAATPPNYDPRFVAADTSCSQTRACIPTAESWMDGAVYPNKLQANVGGDGAVDPIDVVPLFVGASTGFKPLYGSATGIPSLNFDSLLTSYWNNGAWSFAKGTKNRAFDNPNGYGFFDTASVPPSVLDTTTLFSPLGIPNTPCTPCYPPDPCSGHPAKTVTYSAADVSGSGVSFIQKGTQGASLTQADGAPSLFGYIATARVDVNPSCSTFGGLLPAKLTLTSSTGAFPVVTGLSPLSAGAAAGTAITIYGMGFLAGSTVTMGGINAPVTSITATSITATKPALPAGTIPVVTVTSGGRTSKLWDGFLNDFTDVTSGTYHNDVVAIARAVITGGCGGGAYCPATAVSRGQMSVFLLKGKYSSFAFAPIPPTGTMFGDVPASQQFAGWIEELAREGISAGCGSGNFCPADPVTRKEMAVFLLKSKYGSSYPPPACQGLFADVPCPSQFANWIEDAAAKGIMPGGTQGGCSSGNFCPDLDVLRGPMANHLVAAFGL
jgi:hypothetical protein